MTFSTATLPPSPDSNWEQLQTLIESAPDLAPLARLQLRAIRTALDASWLEGVPDLAAHPPSAPDTPLLQARTLIVSTNRLRKLSSELAADLVAPAEPSTRLLAAVRTGSSDPIEMIYAAVTYDQERITRMAAQIDVDPESLGVVAQVSALPLLLASGQRAAPLISGASWSDGFCPVCGAWPMLAELRGLDRDHWLRCGRCATQWLHPPAQCIYCGEQDHEQLSYLAPEDERESRRAVTCERCRGYLKTFATLGPLSAAELLARDLSSIELDLAALEAGYSRPSTTGYRLDLRIEAARSAPSWLRWRS
ncbi:MAG: formate dehydrogenase accessory protein FdhE [Chloroflexota bacterium]